MGFSPTSYTTNTPMEAEDIQDNLDRVKYHASNVSNSDLNSGSLTSKNITKPDAGYGLNTRFTSGEFYFISWGPEKYQQVHLTAHVKQSNFDSKQTRVILTGQTITPQKSCHGLIFCSGEISAAANTILDDNGDSTRIRLSIDGTDKATTLAYIHDDGEETGGNPGIIGQNTARKIFFSTFYSDDFTSVPHTIDLVGDPWLENCVLSNIQFMIELTYN